MRKLFIIFTLGFALTLWNTQAKSIAFELQDAFASAVEQAMPSVVLILAEQHGNSSGHSGQGSGFVIHEDGYVLTNHHVISGKDSFWVTTNDGIEHRAVLIGTDVASDLSVLKIESRGKYPKLEFAPEHEVKPGHWAIAIGAPYNLNKTVTIGVVSNTRRTGVGVNALESYIQTDAVINPGNSGGPLLNLDGKVIGVNNFIYTPSNGNGTTGLNFAIHSELASRVADDFVRRGTVVRPWLGATLQELGREQRQRLNLVKGGVSVVSVYKNSPASRRLRNGDVVLEVNGEAIENPGDIQRMIFKADPDSSIRMKLMRDRRLVEEEVPLELAPVNWMQSQQSENNRTTA